MRIYIASFSLVVLANSLLAQSASSGIEPVRSSHISTDMARYPHIESHLAVDPADPRHMLATAMVVVDGKIRTYPYASFDGGATWIRGQFEGDSSIVGPGAADPVVYFAPRGSALFSTLTPVNGIPASPIARSTDGGQTWRMTTVLPNTDRQFLAIDGSRRPFGGRIYFTATALYLNRSGARTTAPYFARSDDNGVTFPFRNVIAYDRVRSDTVELGAVPMEPVVTSTGLLLLALQGAPDTAVVSKARRDSLNVWALGIMTSDDGGDSFGPPRYAPTPRYSVTGSGARRYRSHSATGYVRTAVDISSGRYRNSMYFVAADYDAAKDRYVARVWRTKDYGKSWTTVAASDAPRGDVANPAIAVNRDGIVAVTWNDRRDDPAGKCWRLYASISVDGGETFLPSQQLSRAPTCANDVRNWDARGSAFNSNQTGRNLAHIQVEALIPSRYPMGGDTQGLAADSTGVFHAAWINGEAGLMQLWYTSFKVTSAVLEKVRSRAVASATDTASIAVPGMEDVTRDVRFGIVSTALDFAKRTFTVTLEIENQSNRTLHGPLRAVLRHLVDEVDNGMGLRNIRAKNSETGGSGIGATWNFDVPGGALIPGSRSSPKTLVFTFEGGVPNIPDGYFAPGFQVYTRAR